MPRLSSIAAQSLQQQILDGTLPAGSALPGQRQLAATLGISRAALREAVSTLEALGLLRSQPGKGVFVSAGETRDGTAIAASVFGGLQATPCEMFQFRAIVEPPAAALAASTGSDEAVAQLAATQAAMEAALHAQDLVAASEADLAFHLGIAALSGNPMLSAVIRSMEAPIAYSLRLPFADIESVWAPAEEHRAVLRAIQARDAAAAEAAMGHHIERAAARVGLAFDMPVTEPRILSHKGPVFSTGAST